MSDSFDVRCRTLPDGTVVLHPVGRLDAHNAAVLVRTFQQEVRDGSRAVINLEDVPFIASSGIGALLALMQAQQEAGHGLAIACPSVAVDSVLRLLNLDQFLTLFATEAEALEVRKAA